MSPTADVGGAPQGDSLFDQTPEFDVTADEPVPDLVFDQSLPEDFTDCAATTVVGLTLSVRRAFSWRDNRFHFDPRFECEAEEPDVT